MIPTTRNSAVHANTPAAQAADSDLASIKQAALDYIEGYYDGDAERMERAVHPDLAKRVVRLDPSSNSMRLAHMSALGLIQATRARSGSRTPNHDRSKDVTVLDRLGNSASVKVEAKDWIDYLHLAKCDGHWAIVNVLWEMKPGR